MSISVPVTLKIPFALHTALQTPSLTSSEEIDEALLLIFLANKASILSAIRAYSTSSSEDPPPYQEQEDGSFIVHVKDLTGKTSHHTVKGDMTPEDLAALVQQQQGIEPCHQRLIWAGRVIFHGGLDEENERTLEEFGVEADSTLHLVLSLRGS